MNRQLVCRLCTILMACSAVTSPNDVEYSSSRRNLPKDTMSTKSKYAYAMLRIKKVISYLSHSLSFVADGSVQCPRVLRCSAPCFV